MDPKTLTDLSALPWTTQLVLASGYCGYLVAYVGIRYNHKAADTIFSSLAFGLVALLCLAIPFPVVTWAKGIAAFMSSIAMGVLWRAWLREAIRELANKLHYSWADGTQSAWDRVQENSKYPPSQLAVETQDGWTFYCTDAHKVMDLPFGPFILGTNGDVLMYVDKSEAPGKEPADVEGVFDEWGSQITYLPKDRIARIAIRFTSSAEAEK